MTPDFTERVRAIPAQRLDLLLRRLNALRPAPAAGVSAAPEPAPSGPPHGTWLPEPVLVPLRLFGALDDAALRDALGVLDAPAPQVLDFRERPLDERYGEALRAAAADAAGDAPLRAALARLDDAEHLLVLVLRAPADAAPSALAARLRARYDELARRPPAQPSETPAREPARGALPAPSAEDLLAEVESFSDADVELLLGQLESGADLQPARAASAPVDPASAEALLAELDQLADDDVDALLRQLSDV